MLNTLFEFILKFYFIQNQKENIFGEDQAFHDMSVSSVKSSALSTLAQPLLKMPVNTTSNKDDATKSISEASIVDEKPKPFDPRLYRPLEVIVSFTIHDVQAHIVKVNKTCET